MEWPTVEDAVFGRLRWYADGSFYGGEVLLGDGTELNVGFDPEDGEPDNDLAQLLAAMLPAARQALRWALANDERIRRLAAEEFTNEYNTGARDPDEDPEPITQEQFAGRIRLGSVWFYPDGHVELGYDDANMFGGHAIQVRCDPMTDAIVLDR